MSDVERLQRRLERERLAREEAERIAEETTRHLFDRRREVELLGTVAAVANATEEPEQALAQILVAVCNHTGWPVGHALLVRDGRLHSSEVWAIAEHYQAFREYAGSRVFAPGEGLPGQVLATGAPAWIADVQRSGNFLRIEGATAAGLRAAFAFPLLARDEVLGVLEFFSPETREPDAVLLGLMAHVGAQAGRVIERRLAQQDLERSNSDLEQFAYRISHDLQEPLRTMTAFAELLERRHAGALEGDAAEFLGYVVDGARRMQGMVSGLLAFSRAGRGRDPDERADLAMVAEEVIGSLKVRIAERKAWVDVGELPQVPGSPAQLGQVLQNLVDNAIKFVPGEEPPQVRVSAEREDEGWVVMVADNGLGIAPEDAERAFGVFERLHVREEFPGHGVGLAVAQRIVEAHGGRIWHEPNRPRGSVFRFTLPDG